MLREHASIILLLTSSCSRTRQAGFITLQLVCTQDNPSLDIVRYFVYNMVEEHKASVDATDEVGVLSGS
jgi:hypothetical protein